MHLMRSTCDASLACVEFKSSIAGLQGLDSMLYYSIWSMQTIELRSMQKSQISGCIEDDEPSYRAIDTKDTEFRC